MCRYSKIVCRTWRSCLLRCVRSLSASHPSPTMAAITAPSERTNTEERRPRSYPIACAAGERTLSLDASAKYISHFPPSARLSICEVGRSGPERRRARGPYQSDARLAAPHSSPRTQLGPLPRKVEQYHVSAVSHRPEAQVQRDRVHDECGPIFRVREQS